jgi:hypothetical protein
VSINIPRPDLVVNDIWVTPDPRYAGQSATIHAQIKNVGTADAGSFKIKYSLDGSYLGEDTLSFGLNKDGASNEESISCTVAGSGNHKVKVVADSGSQITEGNEENNSREETFSWSELPQPDYVISAISLEPATTIANGVFTALVTVKNQGTASGNTSCQLSIWRHKSSTAACGESGDKTVSVQALSVGQTRTYQFSNLNSGSAGTKVFRAFIDSQCSLSESNENNNQSTRSYNIINDTPAAPTSVTASRSFKDKIHISWNSVAGAEGYYIYRNISNDPDGATKILTVTNSYGDDTSAVRGQGYYYWIKSVKYNPTRTSDFSSPPATGVRLNDNIVTFATGTITPNPCQPGQIVTNSNLTGTVKTEAAGNLTKITAGYRDSNGNWVGGEPQVIWSGMPGLNGTSWTGSASIAAPSTPGTYSLWVQHANTISNATAITLFKDRHSTAQDDTNKKLSTS